MIVLELCECYLKTHFISHAESAPARSEDQVARRKVLLWALQIIDALSYVHQQGYVHRDLKMDNVLVSYTLRSDLGLERILSEDM